MATVTVEDPALGQTLTLDSRQTDMFMVALKDATHLSFWDWLLNLLGLLRPSTSITWPADISPDLVVTIEDGGRRDVWQITGRFVLSKPGREEAFQFYFALLLFEWLDQQAAPNP